jgi:hypothetical protein
MSRTPLRVVETPQHRAEELPAHVTSIQRADAAGPQRVSH